MNSYDKTNRIIISGATGFVGRYTLERFLKRNYNVFAISRSETECRKDGVNWIVGDLSEQKNIPLIANQIERASSMIHLAADISVPGDSGTMANNIGGTYTSLEIARMAGVKHFIYLSSIPVIGKAVSTPIDESHPVFPQTPYHWSKYLGEKMVEQYRECFDTICILRIPSPIGVGMRKNVFLCSVMKKLINNEDVEVYGTGKRKQNYLDVRDIADAIVQVAEKEIDGMYLLGGEQSISNKELVELCREITGSKSKISYNIHPDAQENDCWIISYDKAREDFDFSPRYGFPESCRWIYEAMV